MSDVEVDVSEEIGMLYDSETRALNNLIQWMNSRFKGKPTSIQSWMEEVTERIAKMGFNSVVRMLTDENYEGDETKRVWYPSILLVSRIDPEQEFDHDKMGHEVRSNMLGKNKQGNVQKTMVGQTGFDRTKSGLIVPKG